MEHSWIFYESMQHPWASSTGLSMFHDHGHVHKTSMSKFHGIAHMELAHETSMGLWNNLRVCALVEDVIGRFPSFFTR